MSVPQSKRSQGQLEVLTKARDLKIYTIKICTNESSFPKRYRWCLTNGIVDEANEICRLIVAANAVKVELESDRIRRLERQKKAYELTEVLLEDIDTAYEVFNLSSDRAEYWTNKVDHLQSLLRAWMRSDAVRYKDQG